MTPRELISEFLQAHAGLPFCALCLSRELCVDSLVTNNVVWQLQALPGYEMRTTKCLTCARPKRVIVAVGGLALVGPEAELVTFLLTNKGFAFCYSCVAFATEISLQEAQRVVDSLQPLPEFEHLAAGQCSVCTRPKPVISARAFADESAGRVAATTPSPVHYRGWRIDILSYRVNAGWRPFLVIHGPERAVVPAAATWWDPVPTKEEADQYAVAKAREWIDKRF